MNVKLSNGEYLVKGRKVATFTNAEEDLIGHQSELPFLLETEFVCGII